MLHVDGERSSVIWC